MNSIRAQVHDERKSRAAGRIDEQVSCDARTDDSLDGHVWCPIVLAIAPQFTMAEVVKSIVTGVRLLIR
jgi:hypothetical protein